MIVFMSWFSWGGGSSGSSGSCGSSGNVLGYRLDGPGSIPGVGGVEIFFSP